MWKPRTQGSTLMRGICTDNLRLAVVTGLLAALALTAQATRFSDPRMAWDLLRLAEVREEGEGLNWRAVKTIPDALRAEAEDFTVTGYLVPIVPEAELTTFLLVEQPEDCPFCGNGGYGPVLEVTMKSPLPDLAEFTEITLRGTLTFNEDPGTFQLYYLEDARRVIGEI